MSTNCPHCEGDIQTAIDPIVKQRLKTQRKKLEAEHIARLETQQGEMGLLEKRAKELQEAAAGLPELQAELEHLRGTVRTAERTEALRASGLPVELLQDVQTIYDSRMASRSEEERASFADFLGPEGESRSMILLAHHFAAGQAQGAATGAAVAPSTPASALPNGNGGALGQAPRPGQLSAAQLHSYLRSSEYRAMSPKDQRAKLGELEAQVAAERSGTGIA